MSQTVTRPPSSPGKPFVGHLLDFRRDPPSFLSSLAREHGDIVHFKMGPQDLYLLNHPDFIRDVLVTNNRNFVKSRGLEMAKKFLGESLLTSEGEFWRRQRRLAQPAFHRQRINSYAEVMVDYANRSISTWREGEELDISRDMTRLTLEIVVKTLFNADVSKDADHVGAILSQLVKPFASQATLKWILDNRLPTPAHRRYFNAVSEIDRIVFRIISDRRASRSDEGDLLSMLLQAQDDDGSQMTDAQLRDEVMTLFLAGHETTALALSWSWYLLATNPSVEKKFHQELDDVLQGRTPTVSDLTRLTYTEMIAKETMRLYPPAYAV